MEGWSLKQGIKRAALGLSADPVLFAAMAGAVISACFVPPSKDYLLYIDWRVIRLLLSLMLVLGGFQKAGGFVLLMDGLLRLVHRVRTLALVLVGVCFFGSMLMTNDVALLTFVPLGVMILSQTQKQKLLMPVIVLQTVAANLGSMLTPLGNPQNLYLYSLSRMTALQFLRLMALPAALSFLMLLGFILLLPTDKIDARADLSTEPIGMRRLGPWILLFGLCLLAVLRMVPDSLALAAILLAVLILDRRILSRADYGLLLTFLFLFILIGNIKSIPEVSTLLSLWIRGRELSLGILLSQGISNVPAAMLLSKFTQDYGKLIVGVNLGGLGTLIASMASVISYKLYAATTGAQKGKYLAVFTAVNLLFLGVLWGSMHLVFSAFP